MKPTSRKHPDTAGFKEPSWDTFTDVKRALSAYLYRTNREYRTNSDLARDRNKRNKQAQS